MRRIFALLIIITLQNSCTFIFYNYRGELEIEFSISYRGKNGKTGLEIGKFIYNYASKENFYEIYVNEQFDSLYFYGPDYHHLMFKINENKDTTKIYLDYFGYHGFRSNPPLADFIQTLSDSLKIKFGATEEVLKNISNEKISKNKTNNK